MANEERERTPAQPRTLFPFEDYTLFPLDFLEERKKMFSQARGLDLHDVMFSYDGDYEARIHLNVLRKMSREERTAFLSEVLDITNPNSATITGHIAFNMAEIPNRAAIASYLARVLDIKWMRPARSYSQDSIPRLNELIDGLPWNGEAVIQHGILAAVNSVSSPTQYSTSMTGSGLPSLYWRFKKNARLPPELCVPPGDEKIQRYGRIIKDIADGLWFGFYSWAFPDRDFYSQRGIAFKSEGLRKEEIPDKARYARPIEADGFNDQTRLIASALENIVHEHIKHTLVDGVCVVSEGSDACKRLDALLSIYELGLVPIGLADDKLTIWHPPIDTTR